MAPPGGRRRAAAFVADDVAILGPLTLRHVGFAMAGVLGSLVIAAGRSCATRDRGRSSSGLAASVLVGFAFLTQMHERYAYGALVFLVLLHRRPAASLGLGVAFGVVFTLNLLAAVPPTPEIGALLPVSGALGIAGSIAMLAISLTSLALLLRVEPDRAAASGSPAR